jgi:hypothetical protein
MKPGSAHQRRSTALSDALVAASSAMACARSRSAATRCSSRDVSAVAAHWGQPPSSGCSLQRAWPQPGQGVSHTACRQKHASRSTPHAARSDALSGKAFSPARAAQHSAAALEARVAARVAARRAALVTPRLRSAAVAVRHAVAATACACAARERLATQLLVAHVAIVDAHRAGANAPGSGVGGEMAGSKQASGSARLRGRRTHHRCRRASRSPWRRKRRRARCTSMSSHGELCCRTGFGRAICPRRKAARR